MKYDLRIIVNKFIIILSFLLTLVIIEPFVEISTLVVNSIISWIFSIEYCCSGYIVGDIIVFIVLPLLLYSFTLSVKSYKKDN